MAFTLSQMPNLNVQTPDILGGQEKAAMLSQMLNTNQLQKQLAPLQVQEAQERAKQAPIQTQQMQIQLEQQKLEQQSQAAMVKRLSDPNFLKNITGDDTNAQSNGLGFDPDAMTRALVAPGPNGEPGALPKDALGMTQEFIKRSQAIAETKKATAQTNEADAATAQKGYKVLGDVMSGILDAPADKFTELRDKFRQQLTTNPKKFSGVPQQDLAHAFAAETPEQFKAMMTIIGLDSQVYDFHKSKAEASASEQKVIPSTGGLSPDAAQQVQKDVAVATNPQIQQGKEDVAKAEGIARASIEAQIARGSNSALKDVPPHLVAPATADATKAGTEYAAAQAVTQRMNATMEAAKKGNVVAYQIIPEEGTLQITTSQGVHRINKTEIDQYAGGGSLWQRMEGHFGKTLTGKSIPDSVLNDMAEIQKIQADGARSKYENTLKTINDAYGSNFKPVSMGGASSAKTLTQAQIAQAAKDHNVSVEQATADAKKQGYEVKP